MEKTKIFFIDDIENEQPYNTLIKYLKDSNIAHYSGEYTPHFYPYDVAIKSLYINTVNKQLSFFRNRYASIIDRLDHRTNKYK